MAVAPVIVRQRRGNGVARPHVMAPRRPVGAGLSVSEGRRAHNRESIGRVFELRCECARVHCRVAVPLVADAHRGTADRFVVAPAHFDGGVVVRAADRFFVVEPPAPPIARPLGGYGELQ
jgi:hypothetical protein